MFFINKNEYNCSLFIHCKEHFCRFESDSECRLLFHFTNEFGVCRLQASLVCLVEPERDTWLQSKPFM